MIPRLRMLQKPSIVFVWDRAADVLALGVVNAAVLEVEDLEARIAAILIGADQADLVRHALTHEVRDNRPQMR